MNSCLPFFIQLTTTITVIVLLQQLEIFSIYWKRRPLYEVQVFEI